MTNRNNIHILVIEDEADLCEAITSYLCLEGFDATGVGDTIQATEILSAQPMDIIILDIGLPFKDGLSWLDEIRLFSHTGVIISSARGEKSDRLKGLKTGADAYLVKPIDFEELILLIENIYDRIAIIKNSPFQPNDPLTLNLNSSDANQHQQWVLNKKHWQLISPKSDTISLTKSEFDLLMTLFTNQSNTVTKKTIITNLGQHIDSYDFRRLEILIRRLRKKVKETSGLDLPIKTIHAVGYAFTADTGMISD